MFWGFFVCVCVFFCFNYYLFYLFIFGCVGSSFLCEGFLQLRQAGATLHRGARASHHRGLSCCRSGSRRAGSAVVAHGPSCSAARGILPDQGSNLCALHRQADSQPLRHQGSPVSSFLIYSSILVGHHCTACGIEPARRAVDRDRTCAPCSGSTES